MFLIGFGTGQWVEAENLVSKLLIKREGMMTNLLAEAGKTGRKFFIGSR